MTDMRVTRAVVLMGVWFDPGFSILLFDDRCLYAR